MILGLIEDAKFYCDICKTERPSRLIGVAKHTHIGPTGVQFEENVKYCMDKMACQSAATTWSLKDLNTLEMATQLNAVTEMLEAKALDGNLSIKRFWHGIGFGLALGLTIAWNLRWFG